MAKTYENKPDHETASFTGQPDPSDVVDCSGDEDAEDKAWSMATAIAWLQDEDE